MKRLLTVLVASLAMLCLHAPRCATAAPMTNRMTLAGVALREGVSADLSVTVFTNGAPCEDRTVLTLHGMLQAAAGWEPMAALLLNEPPGLAPCRLLALDLPGHGRSGLPSGALFGELTLKDYVSAVLGTLERLHLLGLYPDTLVGHSLGGAVLALVQQRLKDQGTTLRAAHGVRSVVLLGSAVLNPIPDPTWDADVALALLLPFSQDTAKRGVHFAVPVPFWWYVMFSTRATPPEVSPNAPSPEDVIAHGYFAVEGSPVTYEPRAILDDLAVRPAVDAGLFDGPSGTALTMVVYERDLAVDMNLSRAYYAHLTGGESAAHGFVIVHGRYTAHDTHISDPALLLAATPWLLTAF